MSRTLKCGCVVSTTSDTDVRKGYSLSGGCIKRCDEHNGLIMNNTPTEIISTIDYALTAIQNETAELVCCNRVGEECCGCPDVDWPSWAIEVMTKLVEAREKLLPRLTDAREKRNDEMP